MYIYIYTYLSIPIFPTGSIFFTIFLIEPYRNPIYNPRWLGSGLGRVTLRGGNKFRSMVGVHAMVCAFVFDHILAVCCLAEHSQDCAQSSCKTCSRKQCQHVQSSGAEKLITAYLQLAKPCWMHHHDCIQGGNEEDAIVLEHCALA